MAGKRTEKFKRIEFLFKNLDIINFVKWSMDFQKFVNSFKGRKLDISVNQAYFIL